jgi:two-component system, OmpR family, sensor kinase
MSLRLRLTLLYTLILGGVLLLFGALVYGLVSVVLLDQADFKLAQYSSELIPLLRVDSNNQFDTRGIMSYKTTESLYIQVWNNNKKLVLSHPFGEQPALDESGFQNAEPEFNSVISKTSHTRVLSIPLISAHGRVGLLELGSDLSLLDITQRTLVGVLIALTVLAMVVTGLVISLVNAAALAPLAAVTEVATQITRADDLSRRIPQSGAHDDEVGRLVVAFNETLARLEKLFNAQRRFLADVSHELRTPLTVIKGNVGLMRKIGEADEESLVGIETEVDRLSRLVGDLLLLAQAESGKIPLYKAPVELDTVVLEVFQQMRMLAGDRVQVKLADIDQIQVTGDRDRLKQVFLNLIGNAVQYTPAGGQVTLAMRKVGEQVQVSINDTGPGIPAQDLPYIFERFYRAEKSRKRSASSGFGLGLSIAYWIVRSHSGSIEVTSQEGKGSTFCVWLPLAKKEAG